MAGEQFIFLYLYSVENIKIFYLVNFSIALNLWAVTNSSFWLIVSRIRLHRIRIFRSEFIYVHIFCRIRAGVWWGHLRPHDLDWGVYCLKWKSMYVTLCKMDYTVFCRSAAPLRSLAIQATPARDAGIKNKRIFLQDLHLNVFEFRFGNYCIDSVNSWDSCPGMKITGLAMY